MKTSKRFSDNFFERGEFIQPAEEGELLEGMEAFRTGEKFDSKASLEWQIGWRRAKFKEEKKQMGIES